MRNKFEAEEVALKLVAALAPLHRKLLQKDPDQARQLKKAGSSVPANVGEGNRRRGKDRIYHFRVAAGSAGEVGLNLRTAVAWGDLGEGEVQGALGIVDRVLAILWRLTDGGPPLARGAPKSAAGAL